MIKKKLANFLTLLFTIGAVYSVNSACWLIYGQEKEPDSLKRFKKI